MSVIAKMKVFAAPRAFGDKQLVELSCVCADELMPACNDGRHKVHENKTFQQASPSGDAKINLPRDVAFRTDEELYLIFHRCTEPPTFDGALAVVDATCRSVTDYGGTSKLVEVSNVGRYNYDTRSYDKAHPLAVDQFNMRMTIDNPAASIQFAPGKSDYWIGIYRCSDFTMSQALDMATTSSEED